MSTPTTIGHSYEAEGFYRVGAHIVLTDHWCFDAKCLEASRPIIESAAAVAAELLGQITLLSLLATDSGREGEEIKAILLEAVELNRRAFAATERASP